MPKLPHIATMAVIAVAAVVLYDKVIKPKAHQ